MNLQDSYRYLFLDFETTWLDIESDYPIQIALIELDKNFKVIDQYTSYITLPDWSKKLHSNISYITWIQSSTLENSWQSLEVIQQEIWRFFDATTILIGQNISFDIWFLQRFFPDCEYHNSIDTYDLACSSIPYLWSYSLEAIDQYLSTKHKPSYDLKNSLLEKLSWDTSITNHHALYDCIVGIVFVTWFFQQLQSFESKFPIFDQAIRRRNNQEFSIFSLISPTTSNTSTTSESLPILSSPASTKKPTHTTHLINRDNTPTESKFSTAWLKLQDIIPQLPEKSIIAVSHGSKIDIIRRACPDTKFWFLKAEQVISHEKLKQRTQKKIFSSQEVLFVVFYLSHQRDGYRVLDPKLSTHKYILDYLQATSTSLASEKILCSLWWLYYTLEDKNRWQQEFSDYTICILDADWRHTSYNNYAQKWITLSSSVFRRENALYALQEHADNQQLQDFEALINTRTMRLGYFGMEANWYLGTLQKSEIAYRPHNTDFKKSYWLRETLKQERKSYVKSYKNNQDITWLIHKINQLLNHPVTIHRHISQNWQIDYSIAPSVRYIDFSEYLEMFWAQKILFFSPKRKDYRTWITPLPDKNNWPIVLEKHTTKETIQSIKSHEWSTFIISHNSQKSKKLFEELTQEGFDTVATLIGEHITWGVGKAITQYDDSGDNIAIWGYHLLLQFWASGKTFDTIIIYSVYQSLAEVLVDDIKFYGG